MFSPEIKVVTTTEVAERISISRAAARRFLLTLTSLGYLQQIKSNFSLTAKATGIGQDPLARNDCWSFTTVEVIELANRVNDSVSISILEGMDIKYVVRDQKRRIFSKRLVVGDRLPANCSAAGKVLLASLSPDRFDRLLVTDGPLKKCTEKSIADPEALRQELRQIRLQSWAKAEDEMEIGTISIAVPIFDAQNVTVAALAMGSHRMRRTIDDLKTQFLPILLDIAEKISNRIG